MSILANDGQYRPTYWYLMGTLWHELHHIAAPDYAQHTRKTPPYDAIWQNAMNAIRAGFPTSASL